jgi:hypothetical protein
MAETHTTDLPVDIIPRHAKQSTLVGQNHQTPSSAGCLPTVLVSKALPIYLAGHVGTPHSPSSDYTHLNTPSTTSLSLSEGLPTAASTLQANKPGLGGMV